MAKNTTTGEPKAPRAPARRRSDKVTAAAPTDVKGSGGDEAVKVRKSPGRRRSDKNAAVQPMAQAADRGGAVTPSPTAETQATPSWEDVQRRAFELYLERGSENGRDVEDWLEAERQLRNRG